MNINTTHSCGYSIYEGVVYDDSPMTALLYLARTYSAAGIMIDKKRPYLSMPPMIGFVDVRNPERPGYVTSTMAGIIETILTEGLGTVWSSEWIYNHGNEVRTVTWCVDKFGFGDWAVKNCPHAKKEWEKRLAALRGFTI